MSSITHSSLLLKKIYIDLSVILDIDKKYLDVSQVLSKDGIGVENNLDMWLKVFDFKSKDELSSIFDSQVIDSIKNINQQVFDNLKFPTKLLHLFDDFNDKQASKRIINYLQNEI
jgi:hypothetical protein